MLALDGTEYRRLRSGEFYCNDCEVFVLFANKALHQKYHNQGRPKSNLKNVKVMPGFTGDYKPKEALTVSVGDRINLSLDKDMKPQISVERARQKPVHVTQGLASLIDLGDAPACTYCGAIMVRNGSCYKCNECGGTSGCS
jgi:hypothetical protein